MLGLMQDWPLLCHRIIDHAATFHGERKVISRSVEGPIHTITYTEVRARALKVAQRLEKDGVKLGDRVATLAWNTWRHLEAWYGILGIGAIYHTVNPRLFPEQIAWIINHAGDRVMMWYSSANRDEDVFDDPHRFDVRRNPNPHVAFGFGTHFCLGASLARLEVRVMFEELVPRLSSLEITGPVERLRSNFINGVKHMPVRVTLTDHEG